MLARRLFSGAENERGAIPYIRVVPQFFMRVSGEWKQAQPWLRIGGVWRTVDAWRRDASRWQGR